MESWCSCLAPRTGPVVPPTSVGDALGTTPSDWPLGLIVMVNYGIADHAPYDHDSWERNGLELLNTLRALGIQAVWGPPRSGAVTH
jgi:hypothetical protein